MNKLAACVIARLKKKGFCLVVGKVAEVTRNSFLEEIWVTASSEHLGIIVGFQKKDVGSLSGLKHFWGIDAGVSYYDKLFVVYIDGIAATTSAVMAGVKALDSEGADTDRLAWSNGVKKIGRKI